MFCVHFSSVLQQTNRQIVGGFEELAATPECNGWEGRHMRVSAGHIHEGFQDTWLRPFSVSIPRS